MENMLKGVKLQDLLRVIRESRIVAQHTVPGTAKQSGVAEWRNRILMGMISGMMSRFTRQNHFGVSLENKSVIWNRVPIRSEHTSWTIKLLEKHLWNISCLKLSYRG